MSDALPDTLADCVKQSAVDAGFDLVGIAPAITPPGYPDFKQWLDRGFSGHMEWMSRREDAYSHPQHVLHGVRSVVMVARSYKSVPPVKARSGQARVARYAWNSTDYHSDLKQRLKTVADQLHQNTSARTRGIVDTAPLLERDFARLAGLGWFGKNTLLINKRAGSFLFLGALLTTAEIQPDSPHESSHCGTCTRCLDACPTQAFPEPYVLDARRCIAYLNIELRDRPIPTELRDGIQDWMFGCDVCQDVCPWNSKPAPSADNTWAPRDDLGPAECKDFLTLDDLEFRKRFTGTSLERTGRAALARNAAIILGNHGDPAAIPQLEIGLRDPSPIVRGAIAWALGKIGGTQARRVLTERAGFESDATVVAEISTALAR